MSEKQLEILKDYIQALIMLHDTDDQRHHTYLDQFRAEERVEYIETLLREKL